MESSKLQVNKFAQCKSHNQDLKYFCQNKGCIAEYLACGDCLFEKHSHHMKEVRQLSSLISNINRNFDDLRVKNPNSGDNNNDELDALTKKISDEIVLKKDVMLNQSQQKVELFFNQFKINLKNKTNFFKDPSIQIQQINQSLRSDQVQCPQYFNELVQQLNSLEKQVELQVKNNKQISLQNVDVNKLINQVEQSIQDYNKQDQENIQKLIGIVDKFISSTFPIEQVSVFNYTWNKSQSNNLSSYQEGSRQISSPGGCERFRYILSNESLPDHPVYIEIKKNHNSGCYDSFGLCYKKTNDLRNGENDQGWAVRLYGNHGDLSFNGKIHNGAKEIFYDQWQQDSKLGMLYNPLKGTLSYFQNGGYLGTAFTNVENKQPLYICLEICHLGSYEIPEVVELPEEAQYQDLL